MAAVSFIVTIYNKRPHLPALLRGLAEQNGLAQAEFLFIDDGSSDGSAAFLEEALGTPPFAALAGDARILVQENCGPARATNRGIALAKHPWIKLVDGDDRLLPGATARLVAAAERSGADVVFGRLLDRPGAVPVRDGEPAMVPDALALLARRMDFNPSATLIATELARRVGGCDERVFIQDYSLMLRAARRARFLSVPWSIAATPEGSAGRLSEDPAQILHDLNAANLWHLTDHPDTAPSIQALMARRAAGRAWHWARRHRGVGYLSAEFRRHLLSYGPIADARAAIEASCASFRRRASIRVPA